MTTTNGWPFLVARGVRKGYRTILAPDFLVQGRRHTLLAERVGGSASEGRTSVEHVTDEVSGLLTVTYRVEPALADELIDGPPHDGQHALLDQHGRPLELLYGLVTTSSATVGDRDLRHARDEAVSSYRRFLADDTTDVQQSASIVLLDPALAAPTAAGITEMVPVPTSGTTVELSRSGATTPVAPRAAQPSRQEVSFGHGAAHHRPLRVTLLAALALVAAFTLGGLLLKDTADEVTVTVTDTSERARPDDLPSCDDVHLTGLIRTDGPVAVDYRWIVDGQPTAPRRSHTFAGPGELTVDSPKGTLLRRRGKDHDERDYELVVTRQDAVRSQESAVRKVECDVPDAPSDR